MLIEKLSSCSVKKMENVLQWKENSLNYTWFSQCICVYFYFRRVGMLSNLIILSHNKPIVRDDKVCIHCNCNAPYSFPLHHVLAEFSFPGMKWFTLSEQQHFIVKAPAEEHLVYFGDDWGDIFSGCVTLSILKELSLFRELNQGRTLPARAYNKNRPMQDPGP